MRSARSVTDPRPDGASRRPRGLALAFVLAVVLAGWGVPGPVAAAAVVDAELVYATPGTSQRMPLEGAVVHGAVVVELVPRTGSASIESVVFSLDGRVVQVEDNPPWALAGNDARGLRDLDASALGTGPHTVSAAVTAAGAVTTVTASFTVRAPGELRYSTSADYAGARPLDGASLRGRAAVFLELAEEVVSVDFALDGRPVRTERVAPYDLSGDTGGRSHLLDTSALAPGTHRVTADVAVAAGAPHRVTASFVVPGSSGEPRPRTTKTLTVAGDRFLLDGAAFDMWGIRTASATVSQAQTDHLVAQLDTYRAHGVNTVAVFYMGSRNANYDPFSADGTAVDAGHQARMEQIIRAADDRGMVVVVGIFYQAAPFGLRDAQAVRAAVRTVTTELLPFGNVVLNIANEQNSNEYADSAGVFDLRRPERVVELLSIVHAVDPQRLAGSGGYDRSSNIAIGRAPETDVLLFDTGSLRDQLVEYRQFVAAGIDKPVVNVEQFGASTNGYERGVFPSALRSAYLREVASAAAEPGLSTFFHNGPWVQVLPMRYDLGGAGTAADPGIAWYFEAVRAARR